MRLNADEQICSEVTGTVPPKVMPSLLIKFGAEFDIRH